MNFWQLAFWRSGFWVDGFWSGEAGESAGPITPGFVLMTLQYPTVESDLPQDTPPVP